MQLRSRFSDVKEKVRVGIVRVTRGGKKNKNKTLYINAPLSYRCSIYRLSLSENSMRILWWIWEKWPATFLVCSCFWTRFCLASERNFWPGYSLKWVLKSPVHLLQKCFHSYPILFNKNTRHQRHSRLYSCLPWQLYSQGSKEDCSFLKYKIPICKSFSKISTW